jgi:uncharacterized protein (DUF362 family)
MLVINYGKDIAKNTYECLKASDIHDYLLPSQAVAIKPNLVVSRPASDGATTHPEVVEGIIIFLKEYGVKEICVMESSWAGDSTKRAYKNCGYEYLQDKYQVTLHDLKSDAIVSQSANGYKIQLCRKAVEADFLINVPVLKAHCQTRLTCNLKNLKGCIPDEEKRRFHSLGLHKPIAALNTLIKTGFCVVDGICGDLSFEEGGTPVEANRIIVGQNPVEVDSFCAELIGYRPEEIDYLLYAKQYGVGSFFGPQTKVVELNTQDKPLHSTFSGRRAEQYKRLVSEDSACSACYSSLMFALQRCGGNSPDKLYIGQGYRQQTKPDGIGIGNCTSGFARYVPGCPPKAADIAAFLRGK